MSIEAAAAAVTAIAGTRRVVQLYPPTHPAYGEAVADLEVAIRSAAADEPFVLNLHQGRLYHGSLPISDDVPGLAQVAETLESLSIESLTFQSSFSASDAVGVTEALSLRPSPELDFPNELASRNIWSVSASVLEHEAQNEGDIVREQDRALFRRSVSSIRKMLERVSGGDVTAIAGARTLVEGLIPRLEQDSSALLAMAVARKPEERQLFHAFGVMLYSLLLGHRLGLAEEGLLSLGTGALLHDIGKSAFDLTDPAQAERARLEHSKLGAEMLRLLALEDVVPMLIAYEHHMYVDGSGVPARPASYVAHPYSRVVSITDRFVNLASSPPAGIAALTPDRALVQVLRETNQNFDPFLVRLFANMLGPFPVGSVVRLSDQSAGVVCRPGTDPLSPIVRLTFDDTGLEVDEECDVDLAEAQISIVEVVDADSLGIDVTEIL